MECPGVIYRGMKSGDRRNPTFKHDEDRRPFIITLTEDCTRTGWQALALCLMPNHFHLVMGTAGANPVADMKWFLGTYTARFNRRHIMFGTWSAGVTSH